MKPISWWRLLLVTPLLVTAACKDDPPPGEEDDCPAFTRIVDASFTPGDPLEWRITVEELPAELTFNHATLPQDRLEYRWGVLIDLEPDGEDDYRADVANYAHGEEVTGDILGNTMHNLWRVTGSLGSQVATIDARIEGTTFVLSLPAGEEPGLAIHEGSEHRFETFYDDGEERCTDSR